MRCGVLSVFDLPAVNINGTVKKVFYRLFYVFILLP